MEKKHRVLLTGLIMVLVIFIVGEAGTIGGRKLLDAAWKRYKTEQFMEQIRTGNANAFELLDRVPLDICMSAMKAGFVSMDTKEMLWNYMLYHYDDAELKKQLLDMLTDGELPQAQKWMLVKQTDLKKTDTAQLFDAIGQMLLTADDFTHAALAAQKLCYVWDGEKMVSPEENPWAEKYIASVFKSPKDYPAYITVGAAESVSWLFDQGDALWESAQEIIRETIVSVPPTSENEEILTACYRWAEKEDTFRIMLEQMYTIWNNKTRYDSWLPEAVLDGLSLRSDEMIQILRNAPSAAEVNQIITYCNALIYYDGYTLTDETLRPVLIGTMAGWQGDGLDRLEYYNICELDEKIRMIMDLEQDGRKDTVIVYSSYGSAPKDVMFTIDFGNGDHLTCPAPDEGRTEWEKFPKLYMKDIDNNGAQELIVLGRFYTEETTSEEDETDYDMPGGRHWTGVGVFSKDPASGEYRLQTDVADPLILADFVEEQEIPEYMK